MYELSPTGSTATRSSTSVMPLSAYSTPFQKFIGMLEVLHYFFLGYLVWLTWRYVRIDAAIRCPAPHVLLLNVDRGVLGGLQNV